MWVGKIVRQYNEGIKIYAEISGLSINMNKTNAAWTGSMKNSNQAIYTNFEIKWENEKFKLLGVIFSTDLYVVVGLNYQ